MKFTIRKKLLFGYLGVAIIILSGLVVSSFVMSKNLIFKSLDTTSSMIESDLMHVTDGLYNVAKASYEINQQTVVSNLNVINTQFENFVYINTRETIEMNIVEQGTDNDPVKREIPVMFHTGYNIAAADLTAKVDDLSTLLSSGSDTQKSTVTIFQAINEGLLAIATSIKDDEGRRAVGSYIPKSSDVYQAIMNKETYTGKAYVVDDWYITAYKPLINRNEVIGAIYTGIKQTDMNVLRENITEVKIGEKGFAFIVDEQGKIIIHPRASYEGKSIYDFYDKEDAKGFKYIEAIISQKNGTLSYFVAADAESEDFDGLVEKKVNFRYLENMGWYIVSETDLDEVYSPVFNIRNIAERSRMIIMIISGIALLFILAMSLYMSGSINNVVQGLVKAVDHYKEGELSYELKADAISRGDELGDMALNFRELIENIRVLLRKIKESISVLHQSISDLSSSSKEISTTSNQQAAAVKEMVSTMEDSDRLTKGVANKIGEVAKIADKTKNNVEQGFIIIKDNFAKMEEIKDTNASTITGIKSLNEQIESIWDVVNIINNIADQTKIIAFNAELEASAVGEAGKNFQIVATEIRRLADNTVQSTNEIKHKINEIQHASDSLILASEDGTERIREGWNMSADIRKVFEEILSSAEVSASSANQIVDSVNQQVGSIEQILITLKQISEGIDNFAVSTKSTTQASERLKDMGDNIKEIIKKYKV